MASKPSRRWSLFLAWTGGLALVLILIFGGIYAAFHYTETTGFCSSCHILTPEFTVYQQSPHARVKCVECHIGEGTSWVVKSKISGLQEVYATIFHTYSLPIDTPVENLRPARDTCEKCHWPEKFSGDFVRVYHRFQPDEKNTEQKLALDFRVGGGEQRIARGIHWHVLAQLYYLPLDRKRQDIAQIQVVGQNGSVKEFVNSPEKTAPNNGRNSRRLMDCIDCHNRATHIFRSPDEVLDTTLAQGRIDSSLPFIKKLGLEYLSQSHSGSPPLREFYQGNYPQLISEKGPAIDRAAEELRRLSSLVSFPEWKVDWRTHTDNISHQGCFRCHGKLVSQGDGKSLDANCTLCHYSIPAEAIPER